MYESHFGLRRSPFCMTPDPDFLLLTHSHLESLSGLTHAIMRRKGFVVLTGDAGTGKTTLMTVVLKSIPEARLESSFVLNPMLTASEFLEYALLDFGLSDIPRSKPQRLQMLQSFLLQAHQEQKICVLIVDEAHKLTPEVLEEIRLLTNFEMPDGKLLQIVLAGQTELDELLNREDLRQLKQRIAVRLSVHPLAPAQVDTYIWYRWTKAGATGPIPFEPMAITEIARFSQGIPRLVNAVCDSGLLLVFAEGAPAVTAKHVREVAAELHLISAGDETPAVPKQLMPETPPAIEVSLPVLNSLERYTPPKSSWLTTWASKFAFTWSKS